jgi:chromosome segregation ATPase
MVQEGVAMGLRYDALIKRIEDEERAKNLYVAVAETRGRKLAVLEDKVAELNAENNELKKSDSPDEVRTLRAYNRFLRRQGDRYAEQVDELKKEFEKDLAAKKKGIDALNKKYSSLEAHDKSVSERCKMVSLHFNALQEERKQWKAGGFNAVLEAKVQRLEHEKSLSAIAGFNAGNSTDSLNAKIAQQDEQIKAFRDAFFNLRGEYVELAGYAPDTQLPDEVSRPPRACVFPVLTRTVQDAGADSGGEEHPNVDGRKRGRY